MTKFKIGDHIRIIAPESAWFDSVGVVKSALRGTCESEFFVEGIEPITGKLWFGPHELILAEPPKGTP